MILKLPLPPSANKRLHSSGAGRQWRLSPEAKAYHATVHSYMLQHRPKGHAFPLHPASHTVAVHLWYYVGPKAKLDVDNGAKLILDGMKGTVYVDDVQVVALHAYMLRGCAGDDPHVLVAVESAAPAAPPSHLRDA